MEDTFKKFLEDTSAEVDKKIQAQEMKTAAVSLYTIYKHLAEAGFTKGQALELVKCLLIEALIQGGKK